MVARQIRMNLRNDLSEVTPIAPAPLLVRGFPVSGTAGIVKTKTRKNRRGNGGFERLNRSFFGNYQRLNIEVAKITAVLTAALIVAAQSSESPKTFMNVLIPLSVCCTFSMAPFLVSGLRTEGLRHDLGVGVTMPLRTENVVGQSEDHQ